MNSLTKKSSTPLALVIAAFSLLVIFIAIIFAVQADAASQKPAAGERLITIHDRGRERGILTHAPTLREAFKEASIELDPNDRVEPGLDEPLVASNYEANVYRARPVTIIDGAIRQKVMSSYQTPKQIAEQAAITLQDEDEVAITASTDMVAQGAGVQLTVSRATAFSLVLYGTKTAAYSQQKTVADMLKEKNIVLAGNDTLNVPIDAPLQNGMAIELWRNGKQTITEDQEIAFEIEKVQDANREVGFREVKTPGVKGQRTVTYEVTVQNGVETERKEIQSVITKQSEKQVEIVGFKYPPVAGPAEVLERINFWSNSRGIDANRVARIAKCESGFNPRADSGYYKGIFQHDPKYWADRAAKYGQAGASIYDAEAQIIVSTAMMAAGGWSHWGCK